MNTPTNMLTYTKLVPKERRSYKFFKPIRNPPPPQSYTTCEIELTQMEPNGT